ncbi:glycoside hydrolase family 13 protein [Armillaria luteobubalina]|uniref:Glycoside hydrolase family 13 protein n=1 Tax=Armillaria luteobubalina TaxID=153913 RepID=A0AA39QD56_9AGAR|nr:glycoside hydrolase family 13 protein [Armillaria luteobubalina]
MAQPWWKSSTVYQIYPVSFFDSNGDGFGDLNGITVKLDYLKELGVDILWLSPIYKSPLADMGYDISDYREIDPKYGTLQDWDNLLKGIHNRGMKLCLLTHTRMDLVVNHTSDEHEWFVKSRSSKDDPKRDWYIWRPPKYDSEGNRHPPNNWRSVFEGSAWDYDADTDEYYLHLYISKQPDLNWANPAVREAVYDLMRFWLDRGCDGFRMDVINIISKVDGLPDAPIINANETFQPAGIHFANGPRVHEYLKEMRNKVLSHYDIVTVGETPFTESMDALMLYVLPDRKELNMVFHFELMELDTPTTIEDWSPLMHRQWKLTELKDIISRWQVFKSEEGFWNAIFIENHDHPRAVSRFGNDTTDELRALSAKMLAILEVTQKGTLYIYQGQELGLKNFPPSWKLEEYKDVASQNYWKRILERRMRETGKEANGIDMEDVFEGFRRKARDHARVPMQWDSSTNAGFSKGVPWMRVNEDYKTWNASYQLEDEHSVLMFYKRALETRKQYPVLIFGEYELLIPEHEHVFAYRRILAESGVQALVLLNFSDKMVKIDLPVEKVPDTMKLVLGNYSEGSEIDSFSLRSYEGRVYMSS